MLDYVSVIGECAQRKVRVVFFSIAKFKATPRQCAQRNESELLDGIQRTFPTTVAATRNKHLVEMFRCEIITSFSLF